MCHLLHSTEADTPLISPRSHNSAPPFVIQLEAEARLGQVQAALLLAKEEQEASHRRTAAEKSSAALQAAEAASRSVVGMSGYEWV